MKASCQFSVVSYQVDHGGFKASLQASKANWNSGDYLRVAAV
jgi:hypothetical protein